MAATKIIPIRTSIQNSVDYICNDKKTDYSLLIHSEHCFPKTAGVEFEHYLNQTRAGGNTIGRHLIQSFAPGETTPEQAHEIGKKLAAEILKGEYAFVMSTHVDRGHIHNHFVWCAANVVTQKRYRSNKNTYHEIRNISDRLCKENELSVIIPQPNSYGKKYNQHFPDKSSQSWRDKLKATIDSLIPHAKDYEDLLKLIQAQGYKIKRGKYISFSAPEQERFTRLKSLGEGYSEEAITRKILTKPERKSEEMPPQKKEPTPTITPPLAPSAPDETLREHIDIAGNPKYAESRGLTQWAKLQNLQNLAAAFMLMQEYGGLEAFNKLYSEYRTDVETIENAIKANSDRIKGLEYLRDDISIYHRTRPVYKQYTDMKKAKGNITFWGKDKAEEFRNQGKNNADIIAHENAKRDLENFERPLRKPSDINAEIAEIKEANVTNNKSLEIRKSQLKKMGAIHSHLHFLQREFAPPPPPKQEQTRTQTKKRNDYNL